jgi:hypothetical protein
MEGVEGVAGLGCRLVVGKMVMDGKKAFGVDWEEVQLQRPLVAKEAARSAEEGMQSWRGQR